MDTTAALTILRLPIADLHPDPANARAHGERNLDAIRASLARFGQAEPLVVQRSTRRVIGGNGRLAAMRALGWTTCDVVELDLDDTQATALGIALNRTGELAEWDLPALGKILESLKGIGELDGVGFTDKEVTGILDDIIAAGESLDGIVQDDVPAPPDAATTQKGDLWILGRHRLLCGDSGSRADLERLLGGQHIHLVNSDPPYNVKVEPRSNNAISAGLSSFAPQKQTHHQKLDLARHPGKAKRTTEKLRAKDRPLANDFVSDEAFDAMLRAWFGNFAHALEPGRGFYIWGGYANCANYPSALAESELYFSQAIIWVKEHPVLTRKDFMGNHEWCQPAGTKVLTPHGEVGIETLRDDDRVVSFSRHQNAMIGVRTGAPVTRTVRAYKGPLLGVVAEKKTTWCTPAHLWTVRLADEAADMWCVYLMKKGDWWRAGKSKLITTWGFGVKQRLYTEGADAVWILSVHKTSLEASLVEQIILAEYGIPLITWAEAAASRRTIADVRMLYERLDLVRMREGALRALAENGRRLEHPLLTKERSHIKVSRRVSTTVRACNLLPGVMKLPVPGTGLSVDWQYIRAVDSEPFEGDVYSMDVAKHGHYVADGVVTHNCFYGWREGAAHQFLGPNNVPDVWSVKKLNHTAMVHLTEKPVELAVRAIQYSSRPGENVLDLFGGSGSTLIACEQTGRNGFSMEIDTLYADVIVERWQKLAGQAAVLDGTNQTFDEVKAQRSAS